MCFSAGASFTASAVLGAAGIASLYFAKQTEQKFFAATPLIFAAQQFIEGIVWVSIQHPEFAWLHNFAMYSFLTLALVVWPVWIPFSVLVLEKRALQRKILSIILGAGIAEALYMLSGLIFCSAASDIECYHIKYITGLPVAFLWPSIILYASSIVLPTFISDLKYMRLLGITLVISYAVAFIFFQYYLASVWCFFAAILSMIIFFITREAGKAIINK